MPIESKAGNEQVGVGKMQIKGVTMATSHGSPPPGTWHTEFSVENKCIYLDTGPTISKETGGRGQTKGKMTKLHRARPRGQNYTAMTQLRMPATIIRWPTADLLVK